MVAYIIQHFSVYLRQITNVKLMKKQLFTLLVIITCFCKSNAQSFQLLDTTGAHGGSGSVAQSTYNFTVDTSAALSFMFNVKNVTSSAITIKVKKRLIYNASNDAITFCVGVNCYPPSTTLSAAVTIGANSILSSGFLTDFTATNTPNTAKVIYTIFNNNTPSDSIPVIMNYNVSAMAGIEQFRIQNSEFKAYPNPASNNILFTYDLKNVTQSASVKIYNMLGSLVKTIPLETYTNNTKADISSLEEGVYIYSIIVGDKAIKTSRLVVSR